jgi:hypothetical protein
MDNDRHPLFKNMVLVIGRLYWPGPPGVKEGDIICVFLGCEVPLVLRKLKDHFVLVGPCFVLGFMDGEAISMMEEGKLHLETFNLR